MSATYTGVVAVWGTSGQTYTGVAAQEPTRFIRSRTLRREADVQEVRDENNDLRGRVRSDHRKMISLTLTPTGTSIATAATNANKFMSLQAGTRIQLVDTRITAASASFSGYYELMSVEFQEDQSAIASISMELEARDANDTTAPAT